MLIVESELALLRHPRLAELATSARPAWLWRADGSCILWSNAVGAAIFGAATAAACQVTPAVIPAASPTRCSASARRRYAHP